jgi:thiosulfate/3-mercaptopyruvate sulfurtransferase
MAYRTLIDTAALAANLMNPSFAVIDCRFDLHDVEWGEREYMNGHVPGAVYAHLDRDLSGAKTGSNGRHPLPEPAALASTFTRWGIDSTIQVVAYDQDTGIFASRLWWLLRWMGHDDVAVLDGGWAKWCAEQRAERRGTESRAARQFGTHVRNDMTVNASQVAGILDDPEWVLLDARAPERFRGETEPLDKAAGHIPGAINYFYQHNLTTAGTFGDPATLSKDIAHAIRDTPAKHVVSYCGSGVTACHNLLALEHAGIRGARLYPGSWSEWSSDPDRPVETGPGQSEWDHASSES